MKVVAKIFSSIQTFQSHHYSLQIDPNAEKMFVTQELRWWNEETLYKMSLKDAPSLWTVKNDSNGSSSNSEKKKRFSLTQTYTLDGPSGRSLSYGDPSIVSTKLTGVSVSEIIAPLFSKGQDIIDYFFSTTVMQQEKGIIRIGGQRFLFLRSGSLSVDLFDVMNSLIVDFESQLVIDYVYDLAYLIGTNDAQFMKSSEILSELKSQKELIAGALVNLSYQGWCFANVHKMNVSPDPSKFCLEFHSVRCFEADLWIQKHNKTTDTVKKFKVQTKYKTDFNFFFLGMFFTSRLHCWFM